MPVRIGELLAYIRSAGHVVPGTNHRHTLHLYVRVVAERRVLPLLGRILGEEPDKVLVTGSSMHVDYYPLPQRCDVQVVVQMIRGGSSPDQGWVDNLTCLSVLTATLCDTSQGVLIHLLRGNWNW